MGRTIRHATGSDTDEILEIYRDARAFMRQSGNPHQWGDGYPGLREVEQDLQDGTLYVMQEDSTLLSVFYFAEGPDATYGYIEGAWTDEGAYHVVHRIAARAGTGAGRQCLEWAKGQARSVRIDTHKDNGPMQHVLDGLGFKRCGTIYLQNGDPRVAFQYVGD